MDPAEPPDRTQPIALDLDEPTTTASAPGPRRASGEPQLLLLSTAMGSRVGKVFPLQAGELFLGRGADCHVQLDDDGISRRHAKIVRTADGGFLIVDLQSRNGTFVNGGRVDSERLFEGDTIQLGSSTSLRFVARHRYEEEDEALRQALAAGGVGIWDWDAATGQVTWSEQVDRVLGLPEGTLSGHPAALVALVVADDRERVRQALRASIELGLRFDQEYRIEPARGALRWLSCKGDVVRDGKGDALRITGTVMDITARKQAEVELHRQSLLFESLYDGVVVTDLSGRVIDWNSSAERMFGLKKAEAIGRTMPELLDPGAPDALTPAILATLEVGNRWSGELELPRDEDKRTLEVVVVPLRDAEGRRIAYLGMHRDITEKKQLQGKLLLSDRLASVGTLAAGVAHEINNPLAYVSANLEFVRDLLDRIPDGARELEEVKAILGETQEGAHRIATIVSDLKTFARSDAEEKPAPVDVHRVVELACKMAQHGIRHTVRLVRKLQPVSPVQAVESRLSQVFLNLIINAGQAIPEDAPVREIRVSARPGAPGWVVVEVRDTGTGMTPEVQARIFDPFFTTKPFGVGTGLGLSICHGIVQGLGGRISVQSELGKGTAFQVHLKAAAVPAVARHTLELPRPPIGGKLLIVDDEPLLLTSLKRMLQRVYQVTAVGSAVEALERVQRGERYDFILCDLMMPEMTGMELHAALEERDPALAERMVFMTGGPFTPRAVAFLDTVKNPTLSKPLDAKMVHEAIQKLASATVPAQNT